MAIQVFTIEDIEQSRPVRTIELTSSKEGFIPQIEIASQAFNLIAVLQTQQEREEGEPLYIPFFSNDYLLTAPQTIIPRSGGVILGTLSEELFVKVGARLYTDRINPNARPAIVDTILKKVLVNIFASHFYLANISRPGLISTKDVRKHWNNR